VFKSLFKRVVPACAFYRLIPLICHLSRLPLPKSSQPYAAYVLNPLTPSIDAIDQALQSITPFEAIGFFVQAGFFTLD
jgi:hypothetical protein